MSRMISVTERSENLKDEMILDSICKCAWILAVSIGFTAAALLIGLLPFLARVSCGYIHYYLSNKPPWPPKSHDLSAKGNIYIYTALNNDLVKADKLMLSKDEAKKLKDAPYRTLMEASHKEYVESMVAATNPGNIKNLVLGFQSLPTPYGSYDMVRMALK